MEADPIIPSVVPNSRHYNGSNRHLRHPSDDEEFPKDEGAMSSFANNNNNNNKQSPYRIMGERKNSLAESSERRSSHTSQGSSSRRQGSFINPAEASVGDETPVGLQLLGEHNSHHHNNNTSSSSSPGGGGNNNDDMNYIDIKSFQKSPRRGSGSAKRQDSSSSSSSKSKKQPPADLSSYNLPDNTIRNRSTSLEEERRQLELEKEAFEKSKAKHHQVEKSMLDVDETIESTQSSEQKFLSLEDVRGIFQDVKGSGILNCVGDEALDGVDDGDNNNNNGRNRHHPKNLYEDSALLGRITSGIRDSLQILSPSTANPTTNKPKTGEIPMEIEIPTPLEGSAADGTHHSTTIENQISSLDRLEEQDANHHAPIMNMASLLTAPPPPPPDYPPPADELLPPPSEGMSNSNNNNPGMQMSPLERKVSKVILQQLKLQDAEEEARLEQERSAIHALRHSTKAPEDVIEGISFLRNKEKAREKLEQEAEEEKAKKEQEEKEANNNKVIVGDEYGDPDLVVEENDSMEGPFGALRKVLTHIYNPSGGNEITLEEYEEKVRENEPPPPPPKATATTTTADKEEEDDDQDIVHEKSNKKKKKKKNIFQCFKSSSNKSSTNNNNNDTKKKKTKKSFFPKFKKSSTTKKKEEQIHDA